MKVGDKIGVRGPKGAFIYTPNMVREIGMVAGKLHVLNHFEFYVSNVI